MDNGIGGTPEEIISLRGDRSEIRGQRILFHCSQQNIEVLPKLLEMNLLEYNIKGSKYGPISLSASGTANITP